jgi:hypothetical protein
MCQYWTKCMFTRDVVGTANARWRMGKPGMASPSLSWDLSCSLVCDLFDDDAVKAWRTVSVVPAVIAFILVLWGFTIMQHASDTTAQCSKYRCRLVCSGAINSTLDPLFFSTDAASVLNLPCEQRCCPLLAGTPPIY